ncbi:hypothetical protein G647_09206 [Cladophialophora carrionii CBS 160.54]|uniref:DUF7779 domain-containing protein n=1 Tax=Cladophialophora carrionii CBS 160.54 TaxID=1279043 RepID=V9CXP3_9EURO|nr:uncharacterized protein G647_09206 [Cladophialophora carrionii CBS 160.54]ETI19374.1 hypothetical protein G647_09206 [Cladophialophora carrionii CBS 160.54]
MTTSPWSDVFSEYSATMQRIQRHTRVVKESAQAVTSRMLYEQHAKMVQDLGARLESINTVSNLTTDGDVKLPCDTFPFPRNKHFSGRKDILAELHSELDFKPGQQQMNSWAIWGIGGIGKTQIALAYAYEQLDQGLQAIFWVRSQTPLDIAQGFTEIAMSLQMKGAIADGDHEQNRYLVMKWLHSTRTPWLLVFDNVESPTHIEKYWPAGKVGSILITSRYQVFELNPASGGCQVPVMTEEEGSSMLQSLLGRKAYSTTETQSARELSREVDGLPLALNLLGGQIRARGTKVENFLRGYQNNPIIHLRPKKTVQNLYYDQSIDSVWETSFEPLDADPSRLLGILSFLSAEGIPRALFQLPAASDLTDDLLFCIDPLQLEETLESVVETALVTNDEDTDMLRVHRLVQEQFRDWLGADQRYTNFLHACRLLYEAFPKQAHGLPLRNEWPVCKQYVEHVMSVCTNYCRYKFKVVRTGDFEFLTKLLASCAWYLMESGSYSELEDVMEVVDMVCEDKNGLLYVQICNTAGVAELERGRVARALPLLQQVRDRREQLLSPTDKDIADIYTTYGNLLMSTYASKEILNEVEQLFDKAIEIDKTHGVDHCNSIMHIRLGNNGILYNLQGRHEKAIEYINVARDYAVRLFGRDTHFDAT